MNKGFSNQNRPPKAYLEGHQDFYGRNFIVTPDVLIPRPETEQIIDSVLSLAGIPYLPGVRLSQRILPPNPVILDIGTGSGCIAITIKKEFPEAKVYASDISKEALKIAQKNAKNHDVPIVFIISHLLEKVNIKTLPTPDLVVANLPYVDKNWDWIDRKSLDFEPKIALYAEDNGLKLIKQLISQARQLRIPRLILEADPCQHEKIIKYAKTAGYNHFETRGFILGFKLS